MEQKTRKRRLKLLEKLQARSKALAKVVGQLEENFEGEELEKAKSVFVDLVTDSGVFQNEQPDIDDMSKVYGLEPADIMLIHELASEAEPELAKEVGEESPPSG